ncbi:hypothetical protein PAXRUDRAFT_18522 [Paxillus rubicundulus Ve08.2h10]|uniref:Uncharacterized protein n=1 Tax=Paxillus rubicundulus Ve08.2h10 TaxID=930991 RepID=A0A0D0DEM1_9AGAM|nr:hypothetical protein PAXRUDRAFT_18522 [Paxillus rubicundulus Ve08.2h10]
MDSKQVLKLQADPPGGGVEFLHAQNLPQSPLSSLGDLTPIPEHDEADSMTMNEDIDISMLPQDALRNADQFLSVITAAGTSKPGYVEFNELDKDSEGASEKIDIMEDQDGTTQVGSDNEESNLELDYLLKQHHLAFKPWASKLTQKQ